MAIIEGIHICIPQSSERADVVIQGMERLLDQRRYGRISRRAFLVAWRKKRQALRLTRDYQELIDRVCHEAKGMCQVCGVVPGRHMHHSVPVAFKPRLALSRSNVMWVCPDCHDEEDETARDRALNTEHAYQRVAQPAQLGTLPSTESQCERSEHYPAGREASR